MSSFTLEEGIASLEILLEVPLDTKDIFGCISA